MTLIKSIDRTDFSLNLLKYPDESYVITLTRDGKTHISQLLMYLTDAMEVFDNVYDYLLTGDLE